MEEKLAVVERGPSVAAGDAAGGDFPVDVFPDCLDSFASPSTLVVAVLVAVRKSVPWVDKIMDYTLGSEVSNQLSSTTRLDSKDKRKAD